MALVQLYIPGTQHSTGMQQEHGTCWAWLSVSSQGGGRASGKNTGLAIPCAQGLFPAQVSAPLPSPLPHPASNNMRLRSHLPYCVEKGDALGHFTGVSTKT